MTTERTNHHLRAVPDLEGTAPNLATASSGISTIHKLISADVCDKCSGTGWKPVAGKSGVIECECRPATARAARIAAAGDLLQKIPPAFRWVNLRTLQPLAAKHPRQGEIIGQILRDPFRSQGFFGKSGIGKTLLGWGIIRLAIEEGRPVYGIKLSHLLDQYTMAEKNDSVRPLITAYDLIETEESCTIFLDEIKPSRLTPFRVGVVYDILDAIYEQQRHQVIVTSNSTLEEIERHYESFVKDAGISILRRIVESHNMAIPKLF
jgi:hypothetical protein